MTFFLKKMTLRKITIDNSVRYIPKSGNFQERDRKPKLIKNNSFPCKQGKGVSQNNKKFLNKVAARGFKYLK